VQDKKIVVVMPAFNEGPVAITIIQQLVSKNYIPVVVEDGSATSLRHAIKDLPVFFLRHRVNLGQGAALQTGFEFAKRLSPDFVVTMDADGQHDAAAIPLLLQPLISDEADTALGSRFLEAGNTGMPRSRKILLKVARFINYIFSGVLLTDAHNGFRAFNRKALEKIIITENRMAHASEILFEIKKHGLRFTEIPVEITYTEYSRKKGQSAWDSFKILFDLILHKLFK
jgi:polyprenyl-phospho-N-acetylgalactosaminyl synthase